MSKIYVAYITSMKKGLPSFVAREIHELKKMNCQVFIYVTKYSKGLYMPEDPIYKMRPFLILLRQILFFFIYFGKYQLLFLNSLKTKSLVDFFIACDFAYDMKNKDINSIHCVEGLRSLNIGYYCKKIINKPLTVTIYADGLYIAPDEELFKKALNECSKVITICEYNKRILINKYKIPERKIELIPILLDTEKLKPQNTFNILIVAQFAERKGHRILFEAVKRMSRDDLRVWVVGNRGTDLTFVDVPKLAKSLDIDKQVIFWGNLPEQALFYLYQACDVFCLPSVDAVVPEGTPVALMEAMAFEKPVISTKHAGIPEYVNEIIINQNDVEELIQAIMYFIDNPPEKKRQGVENRKIIQEKFSITNIGKLNSIFQEITINEKLAR